MFDIVEITCPANGTFKGEWKDNKLNGKATIYEPDGKVHNRTYENEEKLTSEEVLDPNLAWFGDGKPIMGDPNHQH